MTLLYHFSGIHDIHAHGQLLPDSIEVALGGAGYLLAAEGMDGHLLAFICREEDVKHIRCSVVELDFIDATGGTIGDVSLEWTDITQVADKATAGIVTARIINIAVPHVQGIDG